MGLRTRLVLALALVAVVPIAAIAWRAEPILAATSRRLDEAALDRAGAVVAGRLAEIERTTREALDRWRADLVALDAPLSPLFDEGGGLLTRRRRRALREDARSRAAASGVAGAVVIRGAAPGGGVLTVPLAPSVVAPGVEWPGAERAAWHWLPGEEGLALRVGTLLGAAGPDADIVLAGEATVARARLEALASRASDASVRVVPRRPGASAGDGLSLVLSADGRVSSSAHEAGVAALGTLSLTGPAGGDPLAALRRELLRAAVTGLAAAIVVALMLSWLVARPLRRLTAAVTRVAEGEPPPGAMPGGQGEVGRLASAVDRMLAALVSEQRGRIAAERRGAWREIARRVAHEVRNPLSPIRLAVSNVRRARERGPDPLSDALDAELHAIETEVSRLDRLVREFSEFARLPAPERVPARLGDVAEPAVRGQAPDDGRVQIDFAVEGGLDEPLPLDPDLLGQALANLAKNSVEALGERGGTIRVRCRRDTWRTGGGPPRETALLVLEDDGPGIPDDLLASVFEPYVTGRGDAGTGLGLALTRRIVAEHGGMIAADASPLGGARFTVRLPLDGRPLERA